VEDIAGVVDRAGPYPRIARQDTLSV
jgi:hypothetical protein